MTAKNCLYRVGQKLVHMGQKNVCRTSVFFWEKGLSYVKF